MGNWVLFLLAPMRAVRRLSPGILCSCLVFVAASAGAVSTVYPVTGGHVNIDVQLNGISIGSANGVGLTGVSVTADTALTNLEALELSITPNVPISLSQTFGGYDEIIVESATLTSVLGFTTHSSSGTPTFYNANAGPLEVNGSWGGTDTSGTNPTVTGQAITYDVLAVTGIVNTVPFLLINGVTINSLDGADFGEPGEILTVVASYYVLTPEPGTGLLAAFGFLILGWRQRRGARSR